MIFTGNNVQVRDSTLSSLCVKCAFISNPHDTKRILGRRARYTKKLRSCAHWKPSWVRIEVRANHEQGWANIPLVLLSRSCMHARVRLPPRLSDVCHASRLGLEIFERLVPLIAQLFRIRIAMLTFWLILVKVPCISRASEVRYNGTVDFAPVQAVPVDVLEPRV